MTWAVCGGDATRYETIMAGSLGRARRSPRTVRPGQPGRESRSRRRVRARGRDPGRSRRRRRPSPCRVRDLAHGAGTPPRAAAAAVPLTRRPGTCRTHAAAGARGPDLEYVYSSRLTWSLAATDAEPPGRSTVAVQQLRQVQRGGRMRQARAAASRSTGRLMLACGVSLDPEVRADQPAQAQALRRFVALPEVAACGRGAHRRDAPPGPGLRGAAPAGRSRYRAGRHRLDRPDGGLADRASARQRAWPGRTCCSGGTSRGRRPGGQIPNVSPPYMYNTATGQGLGWRVPDAPFIMETFCMADHGIVSGYRRDATGSPAGTDVARQRAGSRRGGSVCTG